MEGIKKKVACTSKILCLEAKRALHTIVAWFQDSYYIANNHFKKICSKSTRSFIIRSPFQGIGLQSCIELECSYFVDRKLRSNGYMARLSGHVRRPCWDWHPPLLVHQPWSTVVHQATWNLWYIVCLPPFHLGNIPNSCRMSVASYWLIRWRTAQTLGNDQTTNPQTDWPSPLLAEESINSWERAETIQIRLRGQ